MTTYKTTPKRDRRQRWPGGHRQISGVVFMVVAGYLTPLIWLSCPAPRATRPVLTLIRFSPRFNLFQNLAISSPAIMGSSSSG
jgi:hypothetical protein